MDLDSLCFYLLGVSVLYSIYIYIHTLVWKLGVAESILQPHFRVTTMVTAERTILIAWDTQP